MFSWLCRYSSIFLTCVDILLLIVPPLLKTWLEKHGSECSNQTDCVTSLYLLTPFCSLIVEDLSFGLPFARHSIRSMRTHHYLPRCFSVTSTWITSLKCILAWTLFSAYQSQQARFLRRHVLLSVSHLFRQNLSLTIVSHHKQKIAPGIIV